MKKLIMIVSILVMPLLILAGTSDFPRGLTVATEAEKATADVVPGEGDIYVPGTLEVDGAVRIDGTLDMTSGIVKIHKTWLTVASSATTKHFDIDVTTISLIAGATTVTLAKGDISMAEHPRNVIADIVFATGESTSTYVGSIVITGVDALGESAEETLTLSTNYVVGSVAWSKITQVVITATTITVGDDITSVNIELGTGDKLGLENDITSSGDIYKIVENSADVQSGGTINTTYNTYLPATTPNNTNYELWYKAKGRN